MLGREGLPLRGCTFGLSFLGLCANGLATFFNFAVDVPGGAPPALLPLPPPPGVVAAVAVAAAPPPAAAAGPALLVAPAPKSITADILICESGEKGLLGLREGRVSSMSDDDDGVGAADCDLLLLSTALVLAGGGVLAPALARGLFPRRDACR